MTKFPAAFTETAKRRVYGRRLGRPLGGQRQAVMDELLPLLQIDADAVEKGTLDFQSLFPSFLSSRRKPEPGSEQYKPGPGLRRDDTVNIALEIGFGNGEHLKAMMEQRPERAYIGAEPFINGMSAFLRSIKDMPHDNIRVWMDDAITLCRALPDKSLSAIYVLNPDPWPKKRHHKRRIVNRDNLNEFHRILKPGGDLIMATDVDDLAEWMVTETMIHGGFEWQANCAADWQTMPEDWFVATRYANKGEAAGRRQTYLLFKKESIWQTKKCIIV